jgi:hypothetical protein
MIVGRDELAEMRASTCKKDRLPWHFGRIGFICPVINV